jgi:hypothetical protein
VSKQLRERRRQRDGRWTDEDVAQDQERIAVNILMCDAAPRHWPGYATPLSDVELALHRPGHRLADSATRSSVSSARQAMIDRATSAYRTDARRPDPDDDDDDDDDDDQANLRHESPLDSIRAPSIKARDQMILRLRDAWRTPVSRDAPAPTLPAPRAGPVPQNGAEPDHREAMYAKRDFELENAWRTSPSRAPQIEREREAVHGGK